VVRLETQHDGTFRRIGVLLLTVVLYGCPKGQDDAPTAPDDAAGLRVSVAVPAGYEIDEDWELAISEWESETNATAEIVEVEDEVGSETPPESTTLLIAPMRTVGQLVVEGWPGVAPEEVAESSEWRDLLGGCRELSIVGGRPTFLPLDCPVLAVYFRSDLLTAAGLAPPETWSDYQRLLETLGEWAPGLSAVEPQAGDSLSALYLARAAGYALHPDNYSFVLDVESGAPLIAEPPFAAALDALAAVQPFLDPASETMRPAECFRAVVEGRAAMGIGFPATDASRASDVAVGVCKMPGAERIFHRGIGDWEDAPQGGHHVTTAGFAGFIACVAATAESPAVHWDLLASINEQSGGLERRFGHRGVCHVSALADAQPSRGLEFGEWREFLDVVAATFAETRVIHDLPLPERAQFEQPLIEAIRSVQNGSETSEAALAKASGEWSNLIEKLGRRRVLNTYRQCVGLSPLPEGLELR